MDKDPIALSVQGVQQLFSKVNKLDSAGVIAEGQEGPSTDELSLDLTDEELLGLAERTETEYGPYYGPIKIRQEKNLAYYLGNQYSPLSSPHLEGQVISSNIMWEVCETYLAAALSKNPEPVVYSDNTEEGNKISQSVKTLLQYHTTALMLRQHMKQCTRDWMVDLLGVGEVFWNNKISDIDFRVCDPKDFVFDKNGYVDVFGDFVGLLGKRVRTTAEKMIEDFPEHEDFIMENLEGRRGTAVVYTVWWNDDYTFTTYRGKVLDKSKNPNFNYGGRNHFAVPKKPFTFLSVYSFGTQPHDVTNIIEQNIPNQNRVTRRTEQIDYNLSKSNNSVLFSKLNFNQEEARQASRAMAKGNPVLVPVGNIESAVKVIPTTTVPPSFFDELETSKNDMRAIAGTQGISAQPPQQEVKTARGMILQQQQDNSRIGGSIGEALENFASNVFNQLTQFYYVYYDEKHYASVLGTLKAVEYVQLSHTDFGKKHLTVTVAPDSMKPKDEITTMNQALTLWENQAIDIKTLLTVLDFPDPQKTAAQVWLYNTNPQLYGQLNFPELTQQIQGLVAPTGAGGPAVAPVPQEAPQTLGGVPASASLSNVPLNQ